MTETVEVIVAGTLGALGLTYGWLLLETYLNRRQQPLPPVDPMKVLEERYARGEIDELEYERRRAVLAYGPPLPLD